MRKPITLRLTVTDIAETLNIQAAAYLDDVKQQIDEQIESVIKGYKAEEEILRQIERYISASIENMIRERLRDFKKQLDTEIQDIIEKRYRKKNVLESLYERVRNKFNELWYIS